MNRSSAPSVERRATRNDPEHASTSPQAVERVSIKDAVTHTLEEARMVLPGLQALFGFQLMAVFSERFEKVLSGREQWAHLAALCLIGAAIGLVMTPAAYHRQAEQGQVSEHLLRVSSRLVSWGMLPLMLGLCIDLYLVAHVITQHALVSAALATLLALVLAGLWFAFPQWQRRRADRPTAWPARSSSRKKRFHAPPT